MFLEYRNIEQHSGAVSSTVVTSALSPPLFVWFQVKLDPSHLTSEELGSVLDELKERQGHSCEGGSAVGQTPL